MKVLIFLLAVASMCGVGESFAPQTASMASSIYKSTRNGYVCAKMSACESQQAAAPSRRDVIFSTAFTAASAASLSVGLPLVAAADEVASLEEITVVASGDAKKLFNEGRALEGQGNMAAAQRLYAKVTKVSPRFVYGWSNLGNTQVALADLTEADSSYTTSIDLCRAKNKEMEQFGIRRCDDLYILLLNRGSLRLNNGDPKGALRDLEESDLLVGRPDALVLQNRARARELNGLYFGADKDYTVAISMTSNEVSPFWLRAAMVKFQLGDVKDAFNLMKRVDNRFPGAPEVKAAMSVMLASQGDTDAARQKYLEIPDRQRLRFVDKSYLEGVIAWPPAMREQLGQISAASGDSNKSAGGGV